MQINEKKIGLDHPSYIIAEIGMNYNGDTELGEKQIVAAAKAGVDAVKFQTFHTEDFLSSKHFDIKERKQYELNLEQHEVLKKCANDHNVDFISTPFDEKSVDLLEKLSVPCYKVASGDLTNYPLIQYIAGKGKPILFSTGYATLSEIHATYELIRSRSNVPVGIFHCVASYPADISDVHLRNITALQNSISCVVGFSDHSLDYALLPPVAVALGARIIEKHFTIDRALPGYDHHFSLDPVMMEELVCNVRKVELALGNTRGETGVISSEYERVKTARRSLFWSSDFKEGDEIVEKHFVLKRPGTGLSYQYINELVGKKLCQDVGYDEMVQIGQIR